MVVRAYAILRGEVGRKFLVAEVKRIEKMSIADTQRLAKEAEKIIQETIMSKSKMPTGKLASMFFAEPIPNGWGVGDINRLDEKVPYWNHIDKGSEGIGANWEHYLPKGFWEGGRWVQSDSGFAGIKPKSPIQAMHYISETLQKMESKITFILNRSSKNTFVSAWGTNVRFGPSNPKG